MSGNSIEMSVAGDRSRLLDAIPGEVRYTLYEKDFERDYLRHLEHRDMEFLGSVVAGNQPDKLHASVFARLAKGELVPLQGANATEFPIAWRNLLNHGEAGLLLPVMYEVGGAMGTGQVLVGVLLAIHAASKPFDGAAWLRAVCDASLVGEPVYVQQAARRMSREQKTFALLEQINDLEHKSKSSKDFLGGLVYLMKEGLGLSSCGVLLQADDQRGRWCFVAQAGVPQQELQNQYLAGEGQGLRGLVLQGKMTLSDHVEEDKRSLQRFGEYASTPHSFLGVPILTSPGLLPDGALVCLRQRKHVSDELYFSRSEQALASAVVSKIAAGRAAAASRETARLQRERQLESWISWSRPGSEQDVFQSLLALFRDNLGANRLLLSLVDRDRGRIVGKATLGFREELVLATDRKIYATVPPEDDAKREDILSVVCREGRVLLVDRNHPRWQNVHLSTANEHGVNRLLLIPMHDSRGVVVGVVLADLATTAQEPMPPDLLEYRLYADQLGSFIELYLDFRRERSTRQLLESLAASMTDQADRHCACRRTLKRLLEGLESLYGFEKSVIYQHDQDTVSLRGFLGHDVNHGNLQDVIYDLRPELLDGSPSLAKDIFLGRDTLLFYEDIKGPAVQQDDRQLVLGHDGDFAAVGIKLRVGEHVRGVLLGFTRNKLPPTNASQRGLRKLARVAAICLDMEQKALDLERRDLEADSERSVIETLGRLGVNAAGGEGSLSDIAQAHRESLDVIVKKAAQLFRADLCGLFLLDDVVIIGPGEFVDREAKITLRAGYGHQQTAVDSYSYSVGQHGLTAGVSLTLRPNTTRDVEHDRGWSRKENQEREKLRSWMGVPLVVQGRDRQHVLGVLTFSKFRHDDRDLLVFTDRDMREAGNIAFLLGLALFNRQQLGRTREELFRFLRHETFDSLSAIQNEGEGLLEYSAKHKATRKMDVATVHKFGQSITASSDFAITCYYAYGIMNRSGRGPQWETSPCDVKRRIKKSVAVFKNAETNMSINYDVSPHGLKCETDAHKLGVMLHILVDNAVKAIRHERKAREASTDPVASPVPRGVINVLAREEEASAGERYLNITVEDNGCGFDNEVKGHLGQDGYHKFTNGTGIGLSMLKHFLSLAPGGGGHLTVSGNPGKGAVFTMRWRLGNTH